MSTRILDIESTEKGTGWHSKKKPGVLLGGFGSWNDTAEVRTRSKLRSLQHIRLLMHVFFDHVSSNRLRPSLNG